jgi:hypothetical protein
MMGMKTNLKEILEIAQTTSDPKTSYKLELLRLIVTSTLWK